MKTRHLILAFFIAVIAVYLCGYIQGHKKGDRASQTLIQALNDTVYHYETKLHGITTYVSEIQQELMSERQARKAEMISKEELRKLNIKHLNEISRLNLRIDTLLEDVGHNGQVVYIPVKDTTEKRPAILLPFEFKHDDQWLSLKGNFNQEGKLALNTKLSLSVDVWTGKDKETKKDKAVVITDCPYIGVIGINSVKLDTPKPKKYSLSIFAGYGVSKEGLSPFIGGGIGRTIVRF